MNGNYDSVIRSTIIFFFLFVVILLSACKPTVIFTVTPGSGCAPFEVTLDASKTKDAQNDIKSYDWDFGDGKTGSGKITTHPYEQPGEYTIKLVVTDSKGNTSDESRTLRVYDQVKASISADDSTIDSTESTILRWQAVEVTSVSIDQGIGEVKNIGQMEVHPDVTTTYTITAQGPCGTITDSITVKVVSSNLTANISADNISGCGPLAVSFNASNSVDPDNDISSYEWYFGDGGSAAGPIVSHTYLLPGTYPAKLIIKDEAGHVSETTQAIHVLGEPLASISADAVVIKSGTATTLRWQALDATSVYIDNNIGQVPSNGFCTTGILYAPTTYTITATGPCGETMTRSITIQIGSPDLEAMIDANIDYGCGPLTVTFDASGSIDPDNDIVSYQWYFGDNATSSGLTTTHTYTQPGTYQVKLVIKDKWDHTSEKIRAIHVCDNPWVRFSALVSAVGWSDKGFLTWQTTDATSVYIDNGIGNVPLNADNFSTPPLLQTTEFTITATGPCGTVTSTVIIEVPDPIEITITSPQPNEIISGSEVTVEGYFFNPNISIDETTYISMVNAGYQRIDDFPGINEGYFSFLVPLKKGLNNIGVSADHYLYINGVGVPNHREINLPVYTDAVSQIIEAYFETSTVSECDPLSATFDASHSSDPDDDIISYEWDFGDYSTASGVTVAHTYANPGEYYVKLVIKDEANHSSETYQLVDVQPMVNISAEDTSLSPGGSTILHWQALNATSVYIEGIGQVPSSGFFTTDMLYAPTTYTITATWPCGTYTSSVTVNVGIPIEVTITSPLPYQNILAPEITVRGYIDNPIGGETIVTVNGYPAFLYENQFVASGIPLTGVTTLTVHAIGSNGNEGEASIRVYSYMSEKLISISCDDITGMSPFETMLKITVPQGFVPNLSSIPPSGGNVEQLEVTDDYQYTLRLTGVGVYTLTATTTDMNNMEYSDSVSIIIQDGQKVDTLLRSKWDEMKEAMRNRDVEGALKNISDLKTDKYREIFTLIQDQLPQMANDMSELELISMRGGLAKYIIKRNEMIDGQQYEIAYFVYFSPDPFGNWTIDEF